MPRKANGGGTHKLYKAYNFRDKDPVIDELRTMVEDHFGVRINNKSMREIEVAGGPSASCMISWFKGTTKRPQSATLDRLADSTGYRQDGCL